MKRFVMLGLAMLLSVAMLGRAEAVSITGDITFGGTILSTLNLGTTTELILIRKPTLVNRYRRDFRYDHEAR